MLTYVNRECRLQGIATKMYEKAFEFSGKPIKPSKRQTTDGKAFWKRFRSKQND